MFGRADVLSALRADVEVDTHQEILLEEDTRRSGHQVTCVLCARLAYVLVYIVYICTVCVCACVCACDRFLSVGALVNLTVGAASIFHKKPTDSLTEHIYYQSIRQRLPMHTHMHTHTHTYTHTHTVEVLKAERKRQRKRPKVAARKQQEGAAERETTRENDKTCD